MTAKVLLSRFTGTRLLDVVGVALLVLWCVHAVPSLHRDKLVRGRLFWFPAHHFLGVDFQHNYYAARHWLGGGDPYEGHFGAPIEAKFCYAPVVLPLFAWCGLLSPVGAVRVWIVALALMAALGAWASWRSRRALELGDVPLLFVLGAVLCSTPVVFALERGNYDLLVLMLVLAAAWALDGRSMQRDLLAGSCLALACWLKLYPGLLIPGLLVLRRPRALCCCLAAVVVLGVADLPHTLAFVENVRRLARTDSPATHGIIGECTHTLTGCWPLLWRGTRWARLAVLPGWLPWFGLALPLIAWVSLQVRRAPARFALTYPYFAWLLALATFLPSVSNDYNLVVLPLAALAVWDRRDPVAVHVLMAFLLLWWQPVRVMIGPELLLLFKVLGLVAVAASLGRRAQEQQQRALMGDAPERSPALALAA